MRWILHTASQAVDKVPQSMRVFTSQTWKRMWQGAIIVLASFFILMNFEWTTSRLLWYVLRLPTPPSSAWYMVEFTNNSSNELFVRVSLVNDRKFRVYNVFENYTREWLGRVVEKQQIVRPGETHLFDIPSPQEPRLGIVLISAFTNADHAGSAEAVQRVGMRLVSRKMADERNRIRLIFDDSDLIELTVHSLDNWAGWTFNEDGIKGPD